MLDQAIATAVKCHSRQWRKHVVHGHRLPYVVHPIEVMKTVWAWGAGAPDILAIAVLHDALEDSSITPKQLARSFGDEIARAVQELSFDPENDGNKDEYIKRFSEASVPALVVKLADRYCNMKDHVTTDSARLKAYRKKSAGLLHIMQQRLPEISRRFGSGVAKAIAAAFADL